MLRKSSVQISVIASAVAFGTLALGCGGGGGGAASSMPDLKRGSAKISVTWPPAKRLVPVASNSVTVSFLDGSSVVASQTIARPTSGTSGTATFASLPARSLTLRAQAFPNTNGSGTAQASASKTVTIVASTTTALAITMASTIDHLVVSPSSPSVVAGSTLTLATTAIDASGATVLAPSTITWSSSNPAVATVNAAGVVTGVTSGSTTITATETESGKTVAVTLTVPSTTGGSTVTVN